MKAVTGLGHEPLFCPIVSDFYSGMIVTVPLFKNQLKQGGRYEIIELYKGKYNNEFVKFEESLDENGFISGLSAANKDCMKVTVAGNDERILLIAAYDNLGKGASGAAVECMNMAIGADKKQGLVL
jgi:N-acetyl-gamma-glutamyl-phosphate reductase